MIVHHPFFEKTRQDQKRFQVQLALVALLVLVAAGGLLFLAGLLPLLAVVVAVLLSIIAPFYDVPGMVRAGKLHYYSPFLLGETERNGKVVLHAGTLFDFYFLFPPSMPAPERKRLALTGMIDGLLQLIERHQCSGRTDLRIRLTSYILNERNAKRLGLETQPTDGLRSILLYYNFFNLTASYSLLHRRLRFPRVRSVQTFEGDIAKLVERKLQLEKFQARLHRSRRRQ